MLLKVGYAGLIVVRGGMLTPSSVLVSLFPYCTVRVEGKSRPRN
jgi:hypothetical protein